MSLIDNMAALSSKLIAIPDKLGYPLYLVEDLAGVEPFKCYGGSVRQGVFVDTTSSVYEGIKTIDEYLTIKVPATVPKPSQELLTVSGELYQIMSIDRDTLNWVIRLRKDRDIRG